MWLGQRDCVLLWGASLDASGARRTCRARDSSDIARRVHSFGRNLRWTPVNAIRDAVSGQVVRY
jgi:hypothetical protein